MFFIMEDSNLEYSIELSVCSVAYLSGAVHVKFSKEKINSQLML